MTAEHIVQHQFKPGQSGNPKGRPKGSGVTDKLRALLDEEVDLKGSKLTMKEALAKVIINKAMKGDHKFVKEVLDRTEGKATERLEVDGDVRMVVQRFVRARDVDADHLRD